MDAHLEKTFSSDPTSRHQVHSSQHRSQMMRMQSRLQKKLRRELILKTSAVLASLAAALIVVLSVDNLLVSLILAFVTNYLLAPIVDVLERRGASRQTAIAVPFIATGVVIAFSIYLIVPLLVSQAMALESMLPKYQNDFLTLVNTIETKIKVYFKVRNLNITQEINGLLMRWTANFSTTLPGIVSSSVMVLLLTPLFAYFMLQDGRASSRRLLGMMPNRIFETALKLHHELNEQMGGFIRARFLEAAIVGVVVWLGLQIMGFPYASLLGLFAAVTNLIPYIGPIIGAVPAVLIALVSEDAAITSSLGATLILVSSVYFVAQLIDLVFIIPLVVARIVNLHPVTVVIVILIGAEVMGILGMVISIPVASAIKLIFQAFYEHLLEAQND